MKWVKYSNVPGGIGVNGVDVRVPNGAQITGLAINGNPVQLEPGMIGRLLDVLANDASLPTGFTNPAKLPLELSTLVEFEKSRNKELWDRWFLPGKSRSDTHQIVIPRRMMNQMEIALDDKV